MAGSSSASRLSNAALWLAGNSSGNAMTSADFIRLGASSYKKIAGIQERNAERSLIIGLTTAFRQRLTGDNAVIDHRWTQIDVDSTGDRNYFGPVSAAHS